MAKTDSRKPVKIKVTRIKNEQPLKQNPFSRSQLFLAALGLAILAFILLNTPYFVKQINFLLNPPQLQQSTGNSGAQNSTQQFSTLDTLNIPALNIIAPVVYINDANAKTYQAALINGVVHYPGSANPGQAGNVYIFGHSSDFLWSKGNYKTVFALLPQIQLGETITLSDSSGKTYTYKVVDKFITDPKNISVLQQDYSKYLLTLQTSYPVGTALRRYIVIAELQE